MTKKLSCGQITENTLVFLDTKLDFKKNLTNTFFKANKNDGFLRNFQIFLPRISLLRIYKSFIKPRLDYEDVTYDQIYNTSFQQKIKKMHYRAKLSISDNQQRYIQRKILSRIRFGVPSTETLPFFPNF